jgi:hypothetical protein
MDKAKAAVRDFMSKSGHHDTTVHENVAPAVTHETVKPMQHENITTAVDKEIHQDHYHRTVQPVHEKEVLPEKHTHNLGAVEHREFDHRDHDGTKRALATEAGKLHDKRVVTNTTQTQSRVPVTEGEHVHHHVHETIQPVIQKEVVQPNVVHTTVPIHEVHHNAAQHHTTTHLPAVSMSEFKKQGGALSGRTERTDAFEGCPKGTHTHSENVGTGIHAGHKADGVNARGVSSSSSESSGMRTSGATTRQSAANSGLGADGKARQSAASSALGSDGTVKKASLMDKLNPKKDADGDGVKGFMK